jgi:RNA polymerase sigma factor (sigma-70 family)
MLAEKTSNAGIGLAPAGHYRAEGMEICLFVWSPLLVLARFGIIGQWTEVTTDQQDKPMARIATISVARQLGAIFAGGSASGQSDRQLLERVAAGSGASMDMDEAAFAAIVARHGPMVLGVCRQLLGDHHDAEDAFQAVFLVLARKARSIRDPDGLYAWLYGVALRTARKTRARLDRRKRVEQAEVHRQAGSSGSAAATAERVLLDRERAEALHREIDRLPGTFRAPVLLCYFEGLTLDEAAQRLRWPVGTLRSRMARARDRLRRELDRRGFALSAAAIGATLGPTRSARAVVSPLLRDSTTRAAIAFAARHAASYAGRCAPAAAIAQEVLRTMLISRLKTALPLLTLFFAAAVLLAGWINRPQAMAQAPRATPKAAAARSPVDEPARRPTKGRMTVVGRVRDPQGRPVPNAAVMVHAASKEVDDRPAAGVPTTLGQATSDASGQFQIEMARISSGTHHMIGATAKAPGFGMGWVELGVDVDQPLAEIMLQPEQVIVGRIFDIKGRVVPGVKVAVEGMGHPKRGPETLPENIEGPHFWGGRNATTPAAWPASVVSDAEGRFTIRGVGQGLRALLMADDPEYARQRIIVDTDDAPESKPVRVALEPAKIFTGRITYADTGKPVPHAPIEIVAYRGGPGYTNSYETDDQGYYRANPMATDRYAMLVFAPGGQPYMNAHAGGAFPFEWPKGEREHRVDLALRRGTMIHGKVVEEGTNRPVVGAVLRFTGLRGDKGEGASWSGTVRTGPDGSYRLPVNPVSGTLAVLGPSDDYVLQELGENMIQEGQPGGQRWYAHAFIKCDLKPGTEGREASLVLRRGATAKVRVVGPDGQPVASARMFSRLILQPQPWPRRRFWGDFHGEVHDGRCELHGLPPDGEVPVYFLDSKNQAGAVAMVSARAAREGTITVRLEPCGMAMARLVDGQGKPLAGYHDPWLLSMVLTPDVEMSDTVTPDPKQLRPDSDYLSRLDPEHHADLITDAQGRITFPCLIPRATHRLIDPTAADEPNRRKVRKWFVAVPGQAIELGDILIEKPNE